MINMYDDMHKMKMEYFTKDRMFPFYIQYGFHEESMYLHVHDSFSELVIVLNGSAKHIVNDEEFYISQGDVFIIGSDTFHGYQDTQDFRICNIMFCHEYFFQHALDIKETAGFQGLFVIEPIMSQKKSFHNMLKLDLYEFEMVKNMVDVMIEEYTEQKPGYKTFLTANFLNLTVLLTRQYSATGEYEGAANDIFGMAKSIAFIESHFMEELSVKQLASIAGFSPRHYTRRFFEIKQSTPVQYINVLRLQKASYYLKSSDLSISTIASQCGFSDSNYFSRQFKKHFHISPTRYRAKLPYIT